VNSPANNLRNWYTFYNGYDPIFTWWNEEPYKTMDQTLTSYAAFLSERLVGLRAEGTQAGTAGQQRIAEPVEARAAEAHKVSDRDWDKDSSARCPARAGDSSDIVWRSDRPRRSPKRIAV